MRLYSYYNNNMYIPVILFLKTSIFFFILNFIWSILEYYYIFVYTFSKKNIKRDLKILHKIFLDAIIILSRCGAVGSARGLGPWGRRFEPCHLDHEIILKKLELTSFFSFIPPLSLKIYGYNNYNKIIF